MFTAIFCYKFLQLLNSFSNPFLKWIASSESDMTHKSEGIFSVVILEYSKMSLNSNNEFQSVYKVM